MSDDKALHEDVRALTRDVRALLTIVAPLVTRRVSVSQQAALAGVSRTTLWRRKQRAALLLRLKSSGLSRRKQTVV